MLHQSPEFSSYCCLRVQANEFQTRAFVLGADLVRTVLPSIIPPSYRGATIRYLYYIRCTLSGQSLILDNGHSHEESSNDFAELVSFLICHNSFAWKQFFAVYIIYFHCVSVMLPDLIF